MTDIPARPASLLVAVLAGAVATIGVAAIWAGIAAIVRGPCAWMAPLAALDAALVLRLANLPPGAARARFALAVTALTILAGNLLVATTLIGRAMGMRPYEALSRMSLDLAWLHTLSNTGPAEAAWYLGALALAWIAGR